MKTIKNIPRYSVYKDSGAEWLEEMPINWKIIKLKYIVKVFNGDSLPPEKKELFSQNNIIGRPYIASKDIDLDTSMIDYNNGIIIPYSLKNYKIAPKGSILLCIEGGSAGEKIAYTDRQVSFVNKLACFHSKKLSNKFLYYSLKAKGFKYQFSLSLSGLIGGVAISSINNFCITIPILETQNRIVQFLDKKISQIDQAIAIKEKQIALLKERQQIIIQRTVTQGLDPNVPMKDSGIEWIGMIPEHWKIIKLKYSTYINQNSLTESTSPNLEFEYVDIGNVTFDSGIIGKEKYTFRTSPSRARRIAKVGDTIVSTVRTYLKAISEIDEQYQYCIYSTGFAVLSPQKELNNKYLTFFIKSDSFTNQVSSVAKGMSYPAINSSELSNLYICIPPYVEQKTIEKHIQKLTLKIEKLLSLYLEQIEKLKEYKATLIDSAVTGKIKITTEE